jgi:putative ABC transport system substrate-binding protein
VIVNIREHLVSGALLSYGSNFPDLFRRTAEIVDKVLHAAKPADTPGEQPTKFDSGTLRLPAPHVDQF